MPNPERRASGPFPLYVIANIYLMLRSSSGNTISTRYPMNPTERNAWLAKEILVHERALRGYLSRFFKNVADVEDVVQETYARLLALSDPASNAVRNWHAFLFTTARNVALDRIRRSRVVSLDALAEMGSADVLDPAPSVDEALNARQELALLSETIASLPDRCRE